METLKISMPRNRDLAAAASAIFNAGQIITSAQVVGIFESIHDESMRTLLGRLFETVQFQNEALESLRLAVERLDSEGGGN
jgi:acyl-CoA reductase-like NAD-dependent aldehyde dehydrogenase